jgi:hypothetical protein
MLHHLDNLSAGTRARAAVAIATGLLFIDIATFGFAVVIKNNQDAATDSIRSGLIDGCERNGNPLRAIVRHQVRSEIQQSQNKALYRQFFPQIPADQLHTLIATQNAQRRVELVKLAPVDCSAQYR